jgi:hypothetical protein
MDYVSVKKEDYERFLVLGPSYGLKVIQPQSCRENEYYVVKYGKVIAQNQDGAYWIRKDYLSILS